MRKLLKKGIAVLLMFALISAVLPQEVSAAAAAQKVLSLNFKVSEDYILGETNATISFKLQADAKSVKVYILDSLGKAKRTFDVGALKANTKKTLTWDGKDSNKKLVAEDYYCVKVVADKANLKSSTLYAMEQTDFAGGNGSKTKPYLVSNSDQLYNIRKYNGKYFKQSKDIDFDFSNIDPLFNMDAPFTGTYDGKGFKISNLTITKPNDEYTALFVAIGEKGKLSNVTLDNVMITGRENVGGLVAYNAGTLMYCKVNGTVAGSKNDSRISVGGIVANNYGNINSCQSSGVVSASKNNYRSVDNVYSGGIAGSNYGNIISSNSEMAVSATTCYDGNWRSNSFAGGISGLNKGILSSCISSGSILATDNDDRYKSCFAGGIVGRNANQVVSSQYKGGSLTADTTNDISGYQE